MSKIAVVMGVHEAFLRSTLRGIAAFTATNPAWHVELFAPSEEAIRDVQRLKPAGSIVLAGSVRPWRERRKSLTHPVVTVHDVNGREGIPNITCDHAACGRMMGRHLRDCGYQNFAFVALAKGAGDAQSIRHLGFCEGTGANPANVPVYSEPFETRGGIIHWTNTPWYRKMVKWLEDLPRPIGIGAYNDIRGYALLEACAELGLRVPDDVAVIGADNDEVFCNLARPPLSSVALPFQEVGLEAIKLLVQMIEGRKKVPLQTVLPPIRVVGRGSSDISTATDDEVMAVAQYIRQHLTNPTLNVMAVVRQAMTGRRSLERRFKKHLGRSILDEIHRVRLERMKQLLVESDLSMQEIADQTGIRSLSRMGTLFRQHVGMAPSEFRTRFRGTVVQ